MSQKQKLSFEEKVKIVLRCLNREVSLCCPPQKSTDDSIWKVAEMLWQKESVFSLSIICGY